MASKLEHAFLVSRCSQVLLSFSNGLAGAIRQGLSKKSTSVKTHNTSPVVEHLCGNSDASCRVLPRHCCQ